jgi:hypothetical protein
MFVALITFEIQLITWTFFFLLGCSLFTEARMCDWQLVDNHRERYKKNFSSQGTGEPLVGSDPLRPC